MKGAEVIYHILKNDGVKYIFGVPGTTDIPLMDALAQSQGIKYISAVHEAVSIGMADGYARASGEVGVVWVHTTPGTANIIGNLFNAHSAGTPMVILAGQQDSRLQWNDPILDSDLLPLVRQYTKACWHLSRGQDIAKALGQALKEASTPPKGPTFLAIPLNCQTEAVSFDASQMPGYCVPTSIRPDQESLARAARLLVDAEQPAIVAGHQVPDADAITELVKLAESLAAPVYTPFQVPKLIFPTNHPLYYGKVPPIGVIFPGLSDFPDVLLLVGSQAFKQFSYIDIEGPLIPRSTRLIQLDLDPRGLAGDNPPDVTLVASPKTGLDELTHEIIRLLSARQRQRSRQRLGRLKKARKEAKTALERDFKQDWDTVPISPARAIKEITMALPQGSVVVDEAVMLSSYIERIMEFSQPGSYFSNITCLGWGLAASLGVALATAKRPVVAIVGDGSALFGLQALWTAAKYQIPVIMVVLNNGGYAAIKYAFSIYSERALKEGDYLGCDMGRVDFPQLARSFGIHGQRIEKPTQVGVGIQRAIRGGGPALLDLLVDPKDMGWGIPRLT